MFTCDFVFMYPELRCLSVDDLSVSLSDLLTDKPVERTASVETERLQPAASTHKPLSEDLFGSVPFVASAGKS